MSSAWTNEGAYIGTLLNNGMAQSGASSSSYGKRTKFSVCTSPAGDIAINTRGKQKPSASHKLAQMSTLPPQSMSVPGFANYNCALLSSDQFLRRKTPSGVLHSDYDGDKNETDMKPSAAKRIAVSSMKASQPGKNTIASLRLSFRDDNSQSPAALHPSVVAIPVDSAIAPAGADDLTISTSNLKSLKPQAHAAQYPRPEQTRHSDALGTMPPIDSAPAGVLQSSHSLPHHDITDMYRSSLRMLQAAQWTDPKLSSSPAEALPGSLSRYHYLPSMRTNDVWVGNAGMKPLGKYTEHRNHCSAIETRDQQLLGNPCSISNACKSQSSQYSTKAFAWRGWDVTGSLPDNDIQFDQSSQVSHAQVVPIAAIAIPDENLLDPEKMLQWARSLYKQLHIAMEQVKQRQNPKESVDRKPLSQSTRLQDRNIVQSAFPNTNLPHIFTTELNRKTSNHPRNQAQEEHNSLAVQPSSLLHGIARRNRMQSQSGINQLPPVDSALPHTPNFRLHAAQHMTSAKSSPSFSDEGLQGSCDASNSWVLEIIDDARIAVKTLIKLCEKSNMTWIQGMAVVGALLKALGDYVGCVEWCSLVLQLDGSNFQVMSILASALMSLERRKNAEWYWRQALDLRPDFVEAAELLVGLLLAENRCKDALEVIEVILKAVLAVPNPGLNKESFGYVERSSQTSFVEQSIRVLYMKGNILYGLHDHGGAAAAFEKVVLMTIQICATLADLVALIVLATAKDAHGGEICYYSSLATREPVLLIPERALETAKLCFGPNGDLPGLKFIYDNGSRSAAIAVVSNSMLSLAKIYQDSSTSTKAVCSSGRTTLKICDILALYYLSFSLQPSASTANNIGILLATLPYRMTSYQHNFRQTTLPGATLGSGVWLAFLYYQYGLELDPYHAHLYTNLGSLLKDLGQLSAAVAMYQKAVHCDEEFDIALANLANALKDQGRTGDAIHYYNRAVQINPNFFEAICGLANALTSVCNWNGRGGITYAEGRLDRWHVDDTGALIDSCGTGRVRSGWMQRVIDIVESQLREGEAWGNGVLPDESSVEGFVRQLIPHLGTQNYNNMALLLCKNIKSWSGQKHEGVRLVRLIERATKSIVRKWYWDRYITGHECPSNVYARPQLPPGLPTLSAPTVLPFHTFTIPATAKQVRMICQRNGLRTSTAILRSPWLPRTVFPPPPPPCPCLNIGYVSSDFNNHPLAHLMQSVFGLHDRRRVNAICYATTPSDKSNYRKKIQDEVPVFRDVSGWTVERVVQQIVDDQVHVLINLNGYTRGAKNEVFAARPAPIQMSFMGFAGTLGAEWCDYILADQTAVPMETLRPCRRNVDLEDFLEAETSSSGNEDWVYGENVIYTEESFFCCDHLQSFPLPPGQRLTWDDELRRRWEMRKEIFPILSDDTIIFGNFNQLYKIDPTTFRTWLRILSRVPNAVLWLLRFPDLGEQHLRATARAWAGEEIASRIVFTDVAPKAVHVARACVIDLFLDTPECNAHTTAADCLWSGTPLLTLPRYPWKMASRMAAGILGGALDRSTSEGLAAWKELVVSSEDAYEDTAVRLARGLHYVASGHERAKGRLVALRKLIWENRRRKGGLFDTHAWVRQIEDAYEEAWRRWVAGEGGDIYMADLRRGKAPR